MKIKVGDQIRIKEWDELAKELDMNFDGDLHTQQTYFNKEARKHVIGKMFMVESIEGEFPLVYRVKTGLGVTFAVHPAWVAEVIPVETVECAPDVMWANLYKDKTGYTVADLYPTKKEAHSEIPAGPAGYVRTFPIDVSETSW